MSVAIHHSTERTPGDRGRAFGRAQAAPVENTVRAYRTLFAAARDLDIEPIRAIGETVGDLLADRWPALREEIAGLAAGSGQDERMLLAINARTEILAGMGPPECSVAGLAESASGALLAQNWDFHPDLRASRIVWVVRQPGGGWFATFTEAGILAKIGLNAAGLGVALNLLATTADGDRLRTPIHVLLRLLLERCENLDAAIALLQRTPVAASSCVTVGQAAHGSARIVSVELSPAGAAVVPPEPHGPVLHTNHFLVAPSVGADTTPADWPDTLARLQELQQRVEPTAPQVLTDVLRSHAGHPYGICRHDDPALPYADRSVTLASLVIDLSRQRMLVADGAPCRAAYEPIEIR